MLTARTGRYGEFLSSSKDGESRDWGVWTEKVDNAGDIVADVAVNGDMVADVTVNGL